VQVNLPFCFPPGGEVWAICPTSGQITNRRSPEGGFPVPRGTELIRFDMKPLWGLGLLA
jgi:hypothetical protein